MRHVLLALALATWSARARAERASDEVPLFVRLAPRLEAQQRARSALLEHKLARLLEQLPDVAQAAVSIALPSAAELPLDEPLPRPKAAVVLVVRGQGPSHDDVWKLTQSALNLAPSDLSLLKRPARSPTRAATTLVRIGPFRVEAGSASGLRWTLALLLLSNALLAALLLRRRTRSGPRPRQRTLLPP